MASRALPPVRKISLPILEASARADTTMAFSVTSPVGAGTLGLQEARAINITGIINDLFNFIIMCSFKWIWSARSLGQGNIFLSCIGNQFPEKFGKLH